jgi:hypothetical protein
LRQWSTACWGGREDARPAPGGGADDHLDLALLDLEEAPAVLAEEVVEPTGVEQLLEVAPGIAHQRQVDDVSHLSRSCRADPPTRPIR